MNETNTVAPATVAPVPSEWTEQDVPVEKIDPSPFQFRTAMDSEGIQSLAESLRQGLINPVLVRPVNDRFQLVGGERRWRAAMVLGWKTIRARVKAMSDDQAIRTAIADNEQRADMNFIEKALACQRLIGPPHEKTVEEIGEFFGKPRSTISEWIALLDHPQGIQKLIANGSLPLRRARSLAEIADKDLRTEMAERIVKEGLTQEQTDGAVKSLLKKQRKSQRSSDRKETASDESMDAQQRSELASDAVSKVLEHVTSNGPIQWLVQFLGRLAPHANQKVPSPKWGLGLLGVAVLLYLLAGFFESSALSLLSEVVGSVFVLIGGVRLVRYLMTDDSWFRALIHRKWSLPRWIGTLAHKTTALFRRAPKPSRRGDNRKAGGIPADTSAAVLP